MEIRATYLVRGKIMRKATIRIEIVAMNSLKCLLLTIFKLENIIDYPFERTVKPSALIDKLFLKVPFPHNVPVAPCTLYLLKLFVGIKIDSFPKF